jgi:hypothetical protein
VFIFEAGNGKTYIFAKISPKVTCIFEIKKAVYVIHSMSLRADEIGKAIHHQKTLFPSLRGVQRRSNPVIQTKRGAPEPLFVIAGIMWQSIFLFLLYPFFPSCELTKSVRQSIIYNTNLVRFMRIYLCILAVYVIHSLSLRAAYGEAIQKNNTKQFKYANKMLFYLHI